MANISLRIASVWLFVYGVTSASITLPSFHDLTTNYPGYKHHGGLYRNHRLIEIIGCKKDQLLHDTSALRLSSALNKIGGQHSLGKQLIRLSKLGKDSVVGKDGLQYIYHPIAYGPYLADKYGYPSVSKLHQMDPQITKRTFWGKQGILRVITYTKHSNTPVGHVALWDCNHFYHSKDWIEHHSLITVEFWESPDSNCVNLTEPLRHEEKSVYEAMIAQNNQKFLHPSSNPSTVLKKIESISQTVNQSPTRGTRVPTRVPLTNKGWIKSQSESRLQSNQLQKSVNHLAKTSPEIDKQKLLHNSSYRRKYIKKYFISNGHLRHAKHRGLSG